jgi:hypothetical protein
MDNYGDWTLDETLEACSADRLAKLEVRKKRCFKNGVFPAVIPDGLCAHAMGRLQDMIVISI